MTDAATPQAPPAGADADPRVERSRRVILSAAVDLLGEVGYGGLTIEAVAARAGVGKSTIYRHWPGKSELVEDAVRTLKASVTVPTAGSLRDRLTAVLQQVAANIAESACLPAVIDAAERDPEVCAIQRRVARDRRQLVVDLLAEGVAAGEVSPNLDLHLLADCLIGPIVVRRLLDHEPFDPARVPFVVSQLLG
ncbi:MAG TPA: TetR/AcrR family transcriptional regulator [Acidimicrobiales bacterium]|jgi:TetR/AcrR family transcriptional regulator of autoinduction and epiphytic fitness|nr:TetR/AcrR family transcriptional regulator [Acidimicrobiales bacterium]